VKCGSALIAAMLYAGLAWAGGPVEAGRAALERGEGKQALAHLLPQAEAGDPEACYWLGRLYFYDVPGVPADYAKARRWFSRAARAGHADAQYKLGGLYFAGRGVRRSLPQAIAWWRRAARQGQAEALNNLGALVALGKGVKQDAELGLALQILAARKGSEAAQENIARKGASDRANALAEQWAASPAALAAALAGVEIFP